MQGPEQSTSGIFCDHTLRYDTIDDLRWKTDSLIQHMN